MTMTILGFTGTPLGNCIMRNDLIELAMDIVHGHLVIRMLLVSWKLLKTSTFSESVAVIIGIDKDI